MDAWKSIRTLLLHCFRREKWWVDDVIWLACSIYLLPRDAVLVRYMLWPCVCLCVCVYLSQISVLLKRLNGLSWMSWFLAQRLPLTHPTLCYEEVWVTAKIRVLSSGTLSKIRWALFVLPTTVYAINRHRCSKQSRSTLCMSLYTYRASLLGLALRSPSAKVYANLSEEITAITTTILRPFVWDYPGEPVPEG